MYKSHKHTDCAWFIHFLHLWIEFQTKAEKNNISKSIHTNRFNKRLMDNICTCPTVHILHLNYTKLFVLSDAWQLLFTVSQQNSSLRQFLPESHSLKMFNRCLHEHCAIITVVISLSDETHPRIVYFLLLLSTLNQCIKLSLKRL